MDEARNFQQYNTNKETPDEFHRRDYPRQQFGRNNGQPDLDGYNDYGISNASRADVESSDYPGTHSVKHGARTTGYRPDIQLHGPHSLTASEQGAGTTNDNRSSHSQLNNGDLDGHLSGVTRYGQRSSKTGKKSNN